MRFEALCETTYGEYDIPTADYKEVTNRSDALTYVKTCELPVVIKKDGLAAGKGVIIAKTRDEAIEGVETLYTKEQGQVVLRAF